MATQADIILVQAVKALDESRPQSSRPGFGEFCRSCRSCGRMFRGFPLTIFGEESEACTRCLCSVILGGKKILWLYATGLEHGRLTTG